jgi:hypothetical protein
MLYLFLLLSAPPPNGLPFPTPFPYPLLAFYTYWNSAHPLRLIQVSPFPALGRLSGATCSWNSLLDDTTELLFLFVLVESFPRWKLYSWWCKITDVKELFPFQISLKKVFFKRQSYHVAQADLELLFSNEIPTSPSEVAGTTFSFWSFFQYCRLCMSIILNKPRCWCLYYLPEHLLDCFYNRNNVQM